MALFIVEIALRTGHRRAAPSLSSGRTSALIAVGSDRAYSGGFSRASRGHQHYGGVAENIADGMLAAADRASAVACQRPAGGCRH